MRFAFYVLLIFISISAFAQRQYFPDVLDLRNQITADTNNSEINVFADLGAWHAYSLPKEKADYGAFIGPMMMDRGCKWLGNNFSQLTIRENGEMVDLSEAEASVHFYPGLLSQQLNIAGLKITLQLIFVSSRESLLETTIVNTSNKNRQLTIGWQGKSLLNGANFSASHNNLAVKFTNNEHRFFISYSNNKTIKIQSSGLQYSATLPSILLEKGQAFSVSQTQRYYLKNDEVPAIFKQYVFSKELQKNEQRWNGYLAAFFSTSGIKDIAVKKVAVKSIVTLTTNWRSAAKDILHDGVFPSIGYHGFWSWDNWKHAAAISPFNPSLAKNCILSLFDYQDEFGMIPDCIYTEKNGNNLRNTKPPLAGWAVWKTFEQSRDTVFVKNIYAKLVRYHNWWYQNRDHDKNGLCEYGSTDGSRVAAGWESGMDNAVRFDSCTMLKNNEHAWSLNQESADLNAYLYAEKIYLTKLAAIAGIPKDVELFKKDASALKERINQLFYSESNGFYFDRNIETRKLKAVEAYEGWLPLWATISSLKQATRISKIMEQDTKFNTFVPLPSIAADDPHFDAEKGYWRGPVWLDQFYFGIAGLNQYGFNRQCKRFCHKLVMNAEGIGNDQPFRENYNPVTGKGLGVQNFSWSAAHVLMLAQEGFFNK